MKKNGIILGLLVLTVLVMGSCASMIDNLMLDKWDKDTPKDQTVTLYFDESITLTHINGERKMKGPLAATFYGKGDNLKPKAILKIPAGEHTLSLQFKPMNQNQIDRKEKYAVNSSSPRTEREEKYHFLPGRNYQIVQAFDKPAYEKAQEEAGTGLDKVMGFAARELGGEFHKLIFVDITK